MVKEILIYIEGDLKQKGNKNAITLRQGFREFFQEIVKESRTSIKPILCGSRESTVRIFLGETSFGKESFLMILVDSEGEIGEGETPKIFLNKVSDKFDFSEIDEEQCHLMVQAMESWFLADKDCLAEFYGKDFNSNSLPQNPNVEKIQKKDILEGLKNATRRTKKGKYGKGNHSGEILQKIDAQKIRESAPHCERLFRIISDKIV